MYEDAPFKKIAVLKSGSLGDFIFALPALSALKKTYPESEIVYLGKKWHKDFLSGRGIADRFIIIPDFEKNNHIPAFFFKKMQNEKFDLGVQLHGGGKNSNPFLLKLGSKFTTGAKYGEAPSLDKTIPYQYYQSEYARWLEVVSLIGVKSYGLDLSLKVLKKDFLEAKKVLGQIKKFIVIHAGASDLRRRWPAGKFAEAGDYFAFKGFTIVLTGTSNEEQIIEDVVKAMRNQPVNLCSKLSLSGLAGVLALSELVISNDTGPLHLADAVGAKTVGIYWCGNIINMAPLMRKKSMCIASWTILCPLCGKDCASEFPFRSLKQSLCRHEASFVKDVSVNQVIKAGISLLT